MNDSMLAQPVNVVMIGATGAVGTEVVRTLVAEPSLGQLTLLGRRPLESISSNKIQQQTIDIFDGASYQNALAGHTIAICTLGVGQPSKISREDYIKIDKDAVLAFATECKAAGVRHFQLLSSVGANAQSRSFYLRIKGELQSGLSDLHFDRLSIFQPSMIITQTNRYGFTQAVTLAVWPALSKSMIGSLRKYRGIPVEALGRAIDKTAFNAKQGEEVLQWDAFQALYKA